MKEFLLNMVKADNSTSSKRVAALTTLASVIILAFIASAKNNWVCPEFMYDGLLMVIAGLFGFNMAENIFKKSVVPVPAPDVKPDAPKPDADEEDPAPANAAVDNPDA